MLPTGTQNCPNVTGSFRWETETRSKLPMGDPKLLEDHPMLLTGIRGYLKQPMAYPKLPNHYSMLLTGTQSSQKQPMGYLKLA